MHKAEEDSPALRGHGTVCKEQHETRSHRASFRMVFEMQKLADASRMLPQQLILVGDGDDLPRCSMLDNAGNGNKRKRKEEDTRMVVDTKPETTPLAHRFITLCSCNTNHALDMVPQLPSQQFLTLTIACHTLDRTETAMGWKDGRTVVGCSCFFS